MNKKISILIISIYLLWTFLGGYKQSLLGINSDHIVTTTTFVTLLFLGLFKKYEIIHIKLLGIFFIYISISLISIIFSENQNKTNVSLLVSEFTYLIISILIHNHLKEEPEKLFKLVSISSLTAAFIVIISFLFLGFGTWRRVSIPIYTNGSFSYYPNGYESSSDPNVLCYFLCMGLINLIYTKNLKHWKIFSLLILFAAILTLSRSGLLSLFLSILITSFSTQKISKSFKKILLPAIATIFFSSVYVSHIQDNESDFTNLVKERLSSVESNSDRLDRISSSIQSIDFKNSLIGNGYGYSTSTSDPHNIYLSKLIDTGLFSLVLLLMPIILYFKTSFKKNDYKKYFLCITIFFYIISLFYWQVRTFYYLIMILIFIKSFQIKTNK